jgi:fascin 1
LNVFSFAAGQHGQYWQTNADGVCADSDTPEGYYLELREPSKLCIKTTSGGYLIAEKNGSFKASGLGFEKATRWEF